MLLGLFPLQLLILFLCSVNLLFWLLCDKRIFFSGPICLVFYRRLVPLWTSLALDWGSFLLWFCWSHFQVFWDKNLCSLFWLFLDFCLFHFFLNFLNLLDSEISMFWIFFDSYVKLFYGIFCILDSLFYLLYCVGDTYFYNSWPLS